MARARNIKPSLFKNEVLGAADPLLTLLFEGLWCLADKEGRLEDRPLRIKAEIFPYRNVKDVGAQLQWLADNGFIRRYRISGIDYIDIPKFKVHQSPHHTERKSVIPEFPIESDGCSLTVKTPLVHASAPVEIPLIPDSGLPDSLIPDSRAGDKSPVRAFSKPSLDDLITEFRGRALQPEIEANKFLNHYESNGWKVGKNSMKSWKAAVSSWITRLPPITSDHESEQQFISRHQDTSWAN